MLCHFGADLYGRVDDLRREAMQSFAGPVEIPEEMREYRV
jgi:hypothetical protein